MTPTLTQGRKKMSQLTLAETKNQKNKTKAKQFHPSTHQIFRSVEKYLLMKHQANQPHIHKEIIIILFAY